MSNVSTAHTVTLFDAKKSQALFGQRLAKVGYKSTKDKETGKSIPPKYPSVCTSVPVIQESDFAPHMQALMPHIRAMLENAQDGVVRSLYESADGALTQVTDSDISVQACIGWLEAESTGGRLTKEFIEAWFKTSVYDYLVAIVAEKLGYTDTLTPEQEATIERHVAGYRGLYASLAGGKTVLQESQIRSLSKVLELVDTDDTCEKLKARLTSMLAKPKIEELLEL